jgi:probable addiction module antidote protein
LKTHADIAHYLEAVFEDGDPALVAAALGDIARAKGMSQIAEAAGLGRESHWIVTNHKREGADSGSEAGKNSRLWGC